MAWLDPRIYAHPKLLRCSPLARWVYVAGIAYSDGFGTYGELDRAAQRVIGSTRRVRAEIVQQSLWIPDESEPETVRIHDWREHNGRRDDALEVRREADRLRKREERARAKSRDNPPDESRDSHVTSSRGARGSEESEEELREPVPVPTSTTDVRATSNGERAQADDLDFEELDYRTALASFLDGVDGAEDEPA